MIIGARAPLNANVRLSETAATGDRMADCRVCGGSGNCNECYGSGKQPGGKPCPYCKGSRQCSRCSGTGRTSNWSRRITRRVDM